LDVEQRIRFDTSGLDATLAYLRDRTECNLRALAAAPGNDFAYRHYRWSNMDGETTAEAFWSRILARIPDGEAMVRNAEEVRDYILAQRRSRWLPGVLGYLPEGHRFDATAYLNLGYDNIAFRGDVAVNLNHTPFHTDRREAVYYLMHELAHAGYLTYHAMPELSAPRTLGELAGNVMFLTQLEGMGVLTPLGLRALEGGLGDPDYVALGDPTERGRRVRTYFERLGQLESHPDKALTRGDLETYGTFSGKPLRLWYVAGCHMAQVIEERRGKDTLRELVRRGSAAFFEAHREMRDPIKG
jgi:hypothetical protein